jgi:hypothetical protein
MGQKTFSFPKTGGGEISKTLAGPNIRRTADFLDLFGVKNFNELRTPEGQINYAMFVLETGRDREKLRKALDICLAEASADIDFDAETFDLRISDEAIQDFFEQRSKTLLSRMSLQ